MTDQNNAAQPGLTDEEIEALAKKHIAPHADRLDKLLPHRVPYQQTEQFRRVKALIGDLLSKLRAEGVQAGDERESFSDWAWRKDGLAIGRMDGQAAAWEAWQERARRAALANTSIAVPENWKLVPLKPTSKMMGAWYDAFNANIKSAARSTLAYRALIDAAPAALASAPVAEDAKGQIEHLDLDNHRLRRALQKLMARLASLLDKDQFANCESIVTATGVEPPQSSTIVDELNSVKANAASVHPGFHGAPVAGEAQGVSVERLAKDPFLAAQLWRNPVDRAPVAGEAQAVPWEEVRDALAMFLSGATGKASKHWIEPLEDATASGPLAKMRARLAAPQASEAVRDAALEVARAALMEIADLADVEADQRGVIVNRALTKIDRMTAPQANKDGGDCAKGGAEAGATSLESRASAYGAVVLLPPLPTPPEHKGHAMYAGSQMMVYARDAVLADRQQRAALPTPSVVKQSLTATQTGEKGESDE